MAQVLSEVIRLTTLEVAYMLQEVT